MKGIFLFCMILLVLTPSVLSLTEKETCSKIYFWIIENEWSFSEEEINNLSSELEANVSFYLDNFNELCYLKNYSDKLPDKPEEVILVIDETEDECTSEVNGFFDKSIPFFNLHIGNLSCNSINRMKWFFSLEKEEDYVITDIKIFPLFCLLVIFIIISLTRSNSWVNKIIKNEERK